jgi:hypothetical protein
MSYDPTEFGSPEEAARNQAAMEREFGMPKQAHSNSDDVGRRVNRIHHDADTAMNNDLGWHGTTREDLRRKWRQG